MKLVIELDSKELQKAIEVQVGKAISELTAEIVIEKVNSIVSKKTERVTEDLIHLTIENQIADKLSNLLDISYLNVRLNNIIRQTIQNGLDKNKS